MCYVVSVQLVVRKKRRLKMAFTIDCSRYDSYYFLIIISNTSISLGHHDLLPIPFSRSKSSFTLLVLVFLGIPMHCRQAVG
jgi:hypothetical protein